MAKTKSSVNAENPTSPIPEKQRLRHEPNVKTSPWKKWGPYLASASGEQSAKTTAKMAMPGITSRTIRRARALITGVKMAWPDFATKSSCLCFAWRSGTEGSDSEGALLRADQQRRQSRRRRQGILLLPRQHADALVHEVSVQISANANFPTRSGQHQQTARTERPGV